MRRITTFLTNKEGSHRTDLGILALIFGIAYFQFLGSFPLLGTDEARYMEIPREMLERGDFVTPTLNYVHYFEKPPLHYWLNAASTLVFGETAFAGRFAGALWGLLGVLLVYHLGRKLFGRREAILSALVVGTSLGVVVQGRVNITDTTLTFCLSCCLGAFLLASRPHESRRGLYYHLFYVFAALAVLAKGLIGIILPGGIILLYLILSRRWELLKEMRLPTGIPLFLLVAAPWFVLISLDHPAFARFFFIHEHFERYLTKSHGRYQPPWFYFPVLLGSMLPWSFFVPKALLEAWQQRRENDVQLFLMIWALLIFSFFSLSDSKLVPYILPIYPALALLVGCSLSRGMAQGWPAFKVTAVSVAVVHLLLGVGLLLYVKLAAAPRLSVAGAGVIGTIVLVQGMVALANSYRAQLPSLLIGLASLSYLLAIFGPPYVYQAIGNRKLTRDLALKVRERADADALIVSFGYEQELPLYTKRRVIVVGDQGELDFGSRQGRQDGWFIQPEQFSTLWAGPRQVFALIGKDDLPKFQETLKPVPHLLGVQAKRALITNRPDVKALGSKGVSSAPMAAVCLR